MSVLDMKSVPCKWCKVPTTYTGTEECDPCHQMRIRVQRRPELAHQMIKNCFVAELNRLQAQNRALADDLLARADVEEQLEIAKQQIENQDKTIKAMGTDRRALRADTVKSVIEALCKWKSEHVLPLNHLSPEKAILDALTGDGEEHEEPEHCGISFHHALCDCREGT